MDYGAVFPPAMLRAPALPVARGPVSALVLSHLARAPHAVPSPPDGDDPVYGDDSALALYVLYELHYRGFAGVDEGWEWEPSLLACRQVLERRFLDRLRTDVVVAPSPAGVAERLRALATGEGGRSLSAYVAEHATVHQVRELAVHRSAYQLKEADPHTWALPRLSGAAKAALVEIQADEYGEGVERDMHQTLFGLTMAELGLDAAYGAYLDALPGTTLATVNLVSLFGLHRQLRGALVGHLAVFEMTSVEPMGRYAAALRRLGFGAAARHFYEVHVVADAHHQHVAVDDLVGGLLAAEPRLARDVLFGALAVSAVERAFTAAVLAAWDAGRSSLLRPVACVSAA